MTSPAADTGPEILEQIRGMERFNAWMFEHFARYVGDRVLEVGSGIGNLTECFIDRSLVVATDIEDHHLVELKERFAHHTTFTCLRVDFMENVVPLLSPYRFDTIVSTNVLEHIADDRKALRNMHDVLQPGGHAALLVPAFPFLYGSMDVHLQHHRRYTRAELEQKVREAGFVVVETQWMNMAGIVGWFLNARIRKVRSLPPAQLRLYERLVPFFRAFEKVVGPPFGLSLIVVARRP